MKHLVWITLVVFILALISVFAYYRISPRVLAESVSPTEGGGYVRIVEVPTDWFDALTVHYNPFYRFEYHLPGDYLWSAVSYSGESYNAQRASITWQTGSAAIVSLDGTSYYRLEKGLWYPTR